MDMETRDKNGKNGATLSISSLQLVIALICLVGVMPSFVLYAYSADAQATRETLADIKGSIEKLDKEKVNKDVYKLGMDFQNKKIDYLIDLTKEVIKKLDVSIPSKPFKLQGGGDGFKESSLGAKVN